MPSTKEIRRRIRSIKSTRQITRAMELVSAAKMRKAQNQALASRVYANLAWDLVQKLADKADPRVHRLLKRSSKVEKVAVVLLTSNRGLIGGFNTSIINAAFQYCSPFSEVEFISLGKKGRDAIQKRGFHLEAEFEKKDVAATVLEIRPLSRLLVEEFLSGKYDRVTLAYMDFVSTLTQRPHIRELLPLSQKPDPTLGRVGSDTGDTEEKPEWDDLELSVLFEPSPKRVLDLLLPRLIEMQIYQAVLENNASEHSARMVAMKNASDAAKDLIYELTMEYNQVRQAAITKEISEIVAGSLSLQT